MKAINDSNWLDCQIRVVVTIDFRDGTTLVHILRLSKNKHASTTTRQLTTLTTQVMTPSKYIWDRERELSEDYVMELGLTAFRILNQNQKKTITTSFRILPKYNMPITPDHTKYHKGTRVPSAIWSQTSC